MKGLGRIWIHAEKENRERKAHKVVSAKRIRMTRSCASSISGKSEIWKLRAQSAPQKREGEEQGKSYLSKSKSEELQKNTQITYKVYQAKDLALGRDVAIKMSGISTVRDSKE